MGWAGHVGDCVTDGLVCLTRDTVEPKLTPAVLEQLCAEHEEIEEFLVALERQVGEWPPFKQASILEA